MRILVGTSGYSYPKWKGRFYPKEVRAKDFLTYYASQFPTVELNNSFYKMPTPEMMKAWAAEAPRDFIFAVKAPQQITHHKRLVGCGALVDELLGLAALLGKKRGPILFQLPPNMKKDLPRLQAFLAALPRRCRAAFEFRHQSWLGDDTYDALRAAGAALVNADTDDLATPMVATTTWGYLRLRREDYVDADIRQWAKRISKQPWKEAFVYFKHEDTAKGPAYGSLLKSILKQ